MALRTLIVVAALAVGRYAIKVGRLALRRWDEVEVLARTDLEIGGPTIAVSPPGGRKRHVALDGASFALSDAARTRRFVSRLDVETRSGVMSFITPPEEGAIAPRCARLPAVPDGALVVDSWRFGVLVDWLRCGGRLGGRTVRELARLASASTSSFAIQIGEFAARMAAEATWERRGPLRSGGNLRQFLGPLFEAARESERASEALVAALSANAALP